MLPFADVPRPHPPDDLHGLQPGDWLALAIPEGQRAVLFVEASGVRLEALDRVPLPLPVQLGERAADALSGFPAGSAFDVVRTDGLLLCDCLRAGKAWLGGEGAFDRFTRLGPLATVGRGIYLPDLSMGDLGEFVEEARADPRVVRIVVKHWASPLVGGLEAIAENPNWFEIKVRPKSATNSPCNGPEAVADG